MYFVHDIFYKIPSVWLWLAGIDPNLTTKASRNKWETTVAEDIMTPQLKVKLFAIHFYHFTLFYPPLQVTMKPLYALIHTWCLSIYLFVMHMRMLIFTWLFFFFCTKFIFNTAAVKLSSYYSKYVVLRILINCYKKQRASSGLTPVYLPTSSWGWPMVMIAHSWRL